MTRNQPCYFVPEHAARCIFPFSSSCTSRNIDSVVVFDGSCDRAEPFQDAFFGVPTRAPNEPWVSRRRGHDLSGGGGERGRRVGRSYMPAPVGRALPAMGPTSFPLDEPVRPTGCHLAPSSAPRRLQGRRALRSAHPLDVAPSQSSEQHATSFASAAAGPSSGCRALAVHCRFGTQQRRPAAV